VSMERRPGLSHVSGEDNYLGEIVGALVNELPDCDDDLLHIYAVLALVKGTHTSSEDVHDAWSAWKNQSASEHESLKPFNELDDETQKLDAKYRDAIHKVCASLSLDTDSELPYTADTQGRKSTLRPRVTRDEDVIEQLPVAKQRKRYSIIDD
jgi:hypothetical protein